MRWLKAVGRETLHDYLPRFALGRPGQPLTPALNLTLEKGSLTGIIGANGTGKSSLLKVIAGVQSR